MVFGKRRITIVLSCIVISTFLILVFDNTTSNLMKTMKYTSMHDFISDRNFGNSKKYSTLLYIITPTYDRPTQIPELVRLSNTLHNVKNVHWIVIEDGMRTLPHVKAFLEKSNLSYTYLSAKDNPKYRYMKGRVQRNLALDWIRQNHPREKNAIFYFADDDNVYTLELFEEIRKTKKVSVFPVAFSGGLVFETPIVDNGKVTGYIGWARTSRQFPVDMAGFALNVNVLFNYPNISFTKHTPVGFMETHFLRQCCKTEELEPLADNCTKVLVWHTKTQRPNIGRTGLNEIDWNITHLMPRLHINRDFYRRKHI